MLVIWAGAAVWHVLEPWLLRLKELPFQPEEGWHATTWFVSDRQEAESLYCVTLTTATTGQDIQLAVVLLGAIFLWDDAWKYCSKMRKTSLSVYLNVSCKHTCTHCGCEAAKTCKCVCLPLNVHVLYVCTYACMCVYMFTGRREGWPLLLKKLHTISILT